MANTNSPRYSLSDFDNLPAWLKRSWNIFNRVHIRTDFKEHVDKLHNLVQTGALMPATGLFAVQIIGLQRKYGLGQGMDLVLTELISNPNAEDDNLLNKIRPPMRFINYGLGQIRPSDDPEDEFQRTERLDDLYRRRGNTPLSRTALVTYLAIPLGTTKDEIVDFISDHYEDARPLIYGANPDELLFKSARHTNGRIRRVTDDEVINERILTLWQADVRPKDIAAIILEEFGKDMGQIEISQKIYQIKRRRQKNST